MPTARSASTSSDRQARARPLWRGVTILAALAVLGTVFGWYLSPHFVVDMATRLWSCI